MLAWGINNERAFFFLWRYWPQLHRPCGHRPTRLHCYQWAGGWGGGLHPGCHLQHRQHCPGFSEGYLHLSRSHRHRHGKVKSGGLLEHLFRLFAGSVDVSVVDPVAMGRNALTIINHTVTGITGYFQEILCTMSDTIVDLTKGPSFIF